MISGLVDDVYHFGFNGQEKDDALLGDGAINHALYWEYDTRLGRRFNLDPVDQIGVSNYVAFRDNPINNEDALGNVPGDGKDKNQTVSSNSNNSVSNVNPLAPQTNVNPFFPSIWYGSAQIQANNVRTSYQTETSQLAKGDKTGRANLKEKYRKITPEPNRSAIEQSRPMKGEMAKAQDINFTGNAAKTNAAVDILAENSARMGKVFLVVATVNSVNNVIKSPHPVQQAVVEAVGWAGAWGGGTAGAEVGAVGGAVGGPWGAFFGGLVGSVVGGIAGEGAVREIMHPSGPPLHNEDVCFTGETVVLTNKGKIKIKDIKVGDSVQSYNFINKTLELKPVINTITKKTPNIYELELGETILYVTKSHPFFVNGKGWVKVFDLKISDTLTNSDNKKIIIKGIKKIDTPYTVYNIEVANNNNYFVSNSNVLVHNKYISTLTKKNKKSMNENSQTYDNNVINEILSSNKCGINKVVNLTSIKDMLYSHTDYLALIEIIKSNHLENLKDFREKNISNVLIRQYIHVYSFLDQNGKPYIATIYDSDELWQDPQLSDIFPLIK